MTHQFPVVVENCLATCAMAITPIMQPGETVYKPWRAQLQTSSPFKHLKTIQAPAPSYFQNQTLQHEIHGKENRNNSFQKIPAEKHNY